MSSAKETISVLFVKHIATSFIDCLTISLREWHVSPPQLHSRLQYYHQIILYDGPDQAKNRPKKPSGHGALSG
jgi:hypothetical protein